MYTIFHRVPMTVINGHMFYIEIARTQKQQETGLAKYSSLTENKAMYFPFNHADYYTFWMKNMHFSIDIIFLQSKKIVAIFPNVPPPTKDEIALPIYQSPSPADSVLEISAGLSKKYGFKAGDSMELIE